MGAKSQMVFQISKPTSESSSKKEKTSLEVVHPSDQLQREAPDLRIDKRSSHTDSSSRQLCNTQRGVIQTKSASQSRPALTSHESEMSLCCQRRKLRQVSKCLPPAVTR